MKIGIGLGISRWRKSGTSAPPAAPTVSGTISNQSVQQGTGIVTYSTAGAFSGVVTTYSLTGGGAGITINPSTGVVSVDRAVVAVNVFSLSVTASNVTGSSLPVGFTLTVTAQTMTLRQEIEGLATQVTPNGRQSVNALQVASAGNLPPGCSIAGKVITFSGTGITLEDWDFTDKRVDMTGTDQTIQNCYWGPVAVVSAAQYPIQLSATSVRAKVRYNTIDGFNGYGGPETMINCQVIGSGATATGPQDWTVEYNRFLYPQSDVLKACGNGVAQWNYYGPLTNYPAGTAQWSAGTTYNVGDYVLRTISGSDALFRSLVSSNTGNPPAASKVDNAFWDSLDPHGDAITQYASDGKGTIHRYNLFDWGDAIVTAVGTTQAIRIVRNTGTNFLMGPVDFTQNIVQGPFDGFHTLATLHVTAWGAGNTYAVGGLSKVAGVYYVSLQAGNINNPPATSPTFWAVTTETFDPGPIRFLSNWVGKGRSTYFVTMEHIDAWSGNVDVLTDAVIPGPVLRVNTIDPVFAVMGQSQMHFILNNGAFYRTIAQPANAGVAQNVTTYLDNDAGSGPTKYEVTAATVAAGQVNPTVAAWGVFWDHVMPGTHFNIVDLAKAGTGRLSVAQDAHADNRWPGFAAMLAAVRVDHDDLDAVIDIWQANDSGTAKTFANEWGPFYTGQRSNGTAYVVGMANPDSVVNAGQVLNHILWDMEAATTAFGRGVFKRDRTKLYFSGWPTFTGGLANPAELRNSSTQTSGAAAVSYPSQLDMPARPVLDTFLASYPSFAGSYVGMAHAANMEGGVHPSTTDPEGQILIGWGIAVAALKVAGMDVGQPSVTGVEVATDGSYADVLVSLPNGGNLTTYEALRSLSAAAIEPPHYQPVMGFEIQRSADTEAARRPVYKVSEASYPVEYRGTVMVANAGAGVGLSRFGRVRITPTTPFTNGDRIWFGRGDASMMLQSPRDVDAKLYRRQPLENIPSFYDAAATYPCPGIWVKPQPPVLVISGVGGADVTAPILSGVSVAKSDTTATLSWSTNEANGTAYWLVDTNATRTAAQVIAGGGAGSGSRAVTAAGSQTAFAATGLSVSTAYYFHLVHVDATGNQSIVSSTSFTTDAAAAAFFTASTSGPYFVGQTDLPTTSQITFSMRIRPVATGAARYLINYDGTSITADVTTGLALRIGVEDGAGAVVRALSATGVTVENGSFVNLIIAIDLAAATLNVRKNGTLTSLTLAAGGVNTFQTGQRGTFLATKTGANQFAADVEYIKVWYSAEADGTEPVAAPFATIAGNAAAVNGITTPFLQSGSPAT